MTMKPSAFSIRHLCFTYPGQESPALNDVSLEVRPGELLVVCGPSGCGKSTLLRQLKTVLAPHGIRTGEILLDGAPLDGIGQREQSERIGFVLQSPENQIVTDKVWHELAFGLESLGVEAPAIRRRVAEMASFFGIQTWFYKDVAELSGGQKQLLNLASVMAMGPGILILDEPTSQLDPIAASDFLATLGRINRELGTTIILTEHRLEEAFPLASRAVVMDGGRVLCADAPKRAGEALRRAGHAMFLAMPAPMRIWAAAGGGGECPLTASEGRSWLTDFAAHTALKPLPEEEEHTYSADVAIEAHGVWFRYEQNLPDVVRGLDLAVKKGEFLALLGGNGTGKTTSLKLLAGLINPQRGEVRAEGKVSVLPQNPQALFVKRTVREDLLEVFQGSDLSRSEQEDPENKKKTNFKTR